MPLLDGVLEHKDALLRGATLFVGGLALVLAGTIVGGGTSKAADLAAGTLAVSGVVVMLLAFFLYVLPPLLPPR